MQNKKGFTLVEVLLVVVLLAIIALITVPSIIKTLNKNNDRKYIEYENILKENLKLYATDHSEELFSNGNLEVGVSYDELLKTNPDINIGDCTNITLKIVKKSNNYNYYVCMVCDKDKETGEYKRTIGENCEESEVIDTISPHATKIEYNSGYFKSKEIIPIKLTLNEEVIGELPKLNIKVDTTLRTLTGTSNGKEIIYNYVVEAGENGVLEILSISGGTITDKAGNVFNLKLPLIKDTTTIIDTIIPICNISKNNQSILTIEQIETNIDKNGYAWVISDYNNINTKKINDNGIYYAWVRDLAKNIGTCSINVTSLDKEKPQVLSSIFNFDGTVTITAKDNGESGLGYYYFSANNTTPNENDNWIANTNEMFTFIPPSYNKFYLFVKDQAGNISDSFTIINPLYLYNTGNEYISTTGSWEGYIFWKHVDPYDSNNVALSYYWRKNETTLEFGDNGNTYGKVTSYGDAAFATKSKIDFSNYKELKVTYEIKNVYLNPNPFGSHTCSFNIFISDLAQPDIFETNKTSIFSASTSENVTLKTVVIDVSTISSSKYLILSSSDGYQWDDTQSIFIHSILLTN